MKTLTQIALATIVFTTSLMAFAEPTTTNEAQSEVATITVKHEAMTVTLTDKHFTSPDKVENNHIGYANMIVIQQRLIL